QSGKDTLEKKEATQSEPKSSSTTRSNMNEEDEKKCMDVVDYLARQAKGIVIEKQGTVTGKGKAHVVVGKRRKSISQRSGLNKLGYSFPSDDEPTKANGRRCFQ
ncbi:hypothetical protein Tco_1260688, partial [Tanacetum coccineum]